ncbi:MAG: glycosyltransferase [Prevotellaceae bacterium]|nr:glycosyltransferase [Prevotellaceae bacterium]
MVNISFNIDTVTIILGSAALLIAILASIVNPFLWTYRRRQNGGTDDADGEKATDGENGTSLPGITIILTTHDDAEVIKDNLPHFLTQDYPDYQVIVVSEQGQGETEEILKRIKAEYGDRLYYTLIPESSRYMSRKKLQITLGVKAAKHEWILLTDPSCCPQSTHWLATMAQGCHRGNDLVMGPVLFDEDTPSGRRFEHILTANDLLHAASQGRAWRTNMQNICFRKDEFLKQEGFRGNLQLIRGEYDFIINKYADGDNTAVIDDNRSILIERTPSDKTWHNRHLFLRASMPLLRNHWRLRLWHYVTNGLLYLSLLVNLGSLVFAAITQRWILLAIAVIALLVLFLVRLFTGRKVIRQWDDSISSISIPFHELALMWKGIANTFRYCFADKNDFTSHKL